MGGGREGGGRNLGRRRVEVSGRERVKMRNQKRT